MGGHIRVGAAGEEPVVVGSRFDLVLSLYQRDGHGPPLGVEHHFAEMPDGLAGALSNKLFVQYLESGLPTARLLTGLGS